MESSRATLKAMAEALQCDCTLIRQLSDTAGRVEEHLIRKRYEGNDFLEIKLVFIPLT